MPTDQLSIGENFKIIGGGSIAGLLLWFIYGGYRETPWWIYYRHHVEVVSILTKSYEAALAVRDLRIAAQDKELTELRVLAYKAADVAAAMVDIRKKEQGS
jgi:hypothetical protein